ncbi:MAG: 6-carboxytetrahydropterin synthase [Candidatus Binatia bacterium]|nr:6-carboxytetrahydropterin synthase [Candidatus Binatia bacterium]
MPITATRYHDFSAGHRVVGHESRCAFLHGHNYRVHFTCQAEELDAVGRVLDFSAIKSRLCEWLEDNWDHKFLAWEKDDEFKELDMHSAEGVRVLRDSVVWVPFNPTAENMAEHLLRVIGPQQLAGTGVRLIVVRIDETRKCSADAVI